MLNMLGRTHGVLQVPQRAAGTNGGELVVIPQGADHSAVLFRDGDDGGEHLCADHASLIKEDHITWYRGHPASKELRMHTSLSSDESPD
ncbi:hypothetical protein ACVWZ8_004886 [Arthrobacter sp. UYCu723]